MRRQTPNSIFRLPNSSFDFSFSFSPSACQSPSTNNICRSGKQRLLLGYMETQMRLESATMGTTATMVVCVHFFVMWNEKKRTHTTTTIENVSHAFASSYLMYKLVNALTQMQEPGKSETGNGCWDFFSGFYLCSQKKCQADCRPVSAAQFYWQIRVMFRQRLQRIKTFFVFELRPALINTSLALEFLFLEIADANKFSRSFFSPATVILHWIHGFKRTNTSDFTADSPDALRETILTLYCWSMLLKRAMKVKLKNLWGTFK